MKKNHKFYMYSRAKKWGKEDIHIFKRIYGSSCAVRIERVIRFTSKFRMHKMLAPVFLF